MYLKDTFSRFVNNKVLTSLQSVFCEVVMKPYAHAIENEVSSRDRVLSCKMVDPRGFAITIVISKW